VEQPLVKANPAATRKYYSLRSRPKKSSGKRKEQWTSSIQPSIKSEAATQNLEQSMLNGAKALRAVPQCGPETIAELEKPTCVRRWSNSSSRELTSRKLSPRSSLHSALRRRLPGSFQS